MLVGDLVAFIETQRPASAEPGGAVAALSVGAEGLAVLTGEDTARLLLFAPDGTPVVEHDLGNRWGPRAQC
jgi:hypothetical protein